MILDSLQDRSDTDFGMSPRQPVPKISWTLSKKGLKPCSVFPFKFADHSNMVIAWGFYYFRLLLFRSKNSLTIGKTRSVLPKVYICLRSGIV